MNAQTIKNKQLNRLSKNKKCRCCCHHFCCDNWEYVVRLFSKHRRHVDFKFHPEYNHDHKAAISTNKI